MGQDASVPNGQFFILIPFYLQLQTLTAFLLESDVIGMSMVVMAVTMMMVSLSSHINDSCRHSQNRRILVLNELSKILSNKPEEQNKPNDNKDLHFPLSSFLQRGPHCEVRPPL